MDDQLHAAGFVEEALEHERVEGRQNPQRGVTRGQVFDQLLGGGLDDPGLVDQPAHDVLASLASREASGDLSPQPRHRLRQFVGAARRLAEPERDGRRHPRRVLDAHGAALHALNAISGVAELEDVAGHAFDREILVDRADDLIFGFEQYLIVGIVGDRPARGQRGQPRAAPAAQHVVDRIVMDQARRAGRGGW